MRDIQRGGSGPWRFTESAFADPRSRLIADLDELARQPALRRTPDPDLYAERTFHDHRRRRAPHGHAGRMGPRRQGNNETAFFMDDTVELVPREQESPGMLANLSGCLDREVLCFVCPFLIRSQFTCDDDLVHSRHFDGHAAQVAAFSAPTPAVVPFLRKLLRLSV